MGYKIINTDSSKLLQKIVLVKCNYTVKTKTKEKKKLLNSLNIKKKRIRK